MPKLSIIVLNWNQPQLTLECIESINALSTPKHLHLAIVVVDNNSTDNSQSLLSDMKLTKASYQYIQNKENLGFAGGNNVGISYALRQKSNYILILNNDTVLDSHLIGNLIDAAKRNKDAIISPKIYFANGYEFHSDRYSPSERGRVIWSVGGVIDWNNMYGFNRGVDEVDTGQFDEETEVDFASGACMFLSAEVFNRVGLFDEKYFLYFEDTDLCTRAKHIGIPTIYTPKAHLWHKVSQSSAIGGNLNDYFITRNRLLFADRYASLRTRFALLRESVRFSISGRTWQRIGVKDFYLRRFGKGSWK